MASGQTLEILTLLLKRDEMLLALMTRRDEILSVHAYVATTHYP